MITAIKTAPVQTSVSNKCVAPSMFFAREVSADKITAIFCFREVKLIQRKVRVMQSFNLFRLRSPENGKCDSSNKFLFNPFLLHRNNKPNGIHSEKQ